MYFMVRLGDSQKTAAAGHYRPLADVNNRQRPLTAVYSPSEQLMCVTDAIKVTKNNGGWIMSPSYIIIIFSTNYILKRLSQALASYLGATQFVWVNA